MVNYKQIQSINLFIVLIVDVAHIFILCNLCNQESKWKTQCHRKALEQYKKNYSKNVIN